MRGVQFFARKRFFVAAFDSSDCAICGHERRRVCGARGPGGRMVSSGDNSRCAEQRIEQRAIFRAQTRGFFFQRADVFALKQSA